MKVRGRAEQRRERQAYGLTLTRRGALRLIGLSGGVLYLNACAPVLRKSWNAAGSSPAFSPIDRALGDVAPRSFSGESPSLAHDVLWDLDRFVGARGGIPAASESVPLVVIGGGIAGLTAAYLLRVHRPIVLEREPRFGGNSRGEAWRGSDYCIGAAYFLEPDAGSRIETLLRELGVPRAWRLKTTEDPVVVGRQRHDAFWNGDSDPVARPKIQALGRYFKSIFDGDSSMPYPDIPVLDPAARPGIDELDRHTFLEHVTKVSGGTLHPHVAAALEHYCWSSMGASAGEVSAAGGLNFYCAEFGNICVLPGGNAAVAERLVSKLEQALPAGAMRPGCMVINVEVREDGALVTYLDERNELRTLYARALVVACPKFVAARVLRQIEAERSTAIARLRYRAYVVANVLLRRAVEPDFYDLFLAGSGAPVDFANVEVESDRQRVTDVVLGTYARPSRSHAILTLYRPLPYDSARAAVLADDAYAGFRRQVEEQLVSEILPLVGARESDVVDLRLARWGHPLPVAAPGLIADRVVDVLRRPFRERVFFVEQDNWALPAFETSIEEAFEAARKIEALLRS